MTSRCNVVAPVGQRSLEQLRKRIGGIDASFKQRKGNPVQAEPDSAMKRIGETMLELLEAKTETFGPLGRRRLVTM